MKLSRQKARVWISTLVVTLFALIFINPESLLTPIAPFLEGSQLGPLVLKLFFNFSIAALLAFLVLALVTLLFGRIYCSLLCPLGIFQDAVIALSRRKHKPQKLVPYIRYAVTLIVYLSAVFGTLFLVNRLDPYTQFGRITTSLCGSLYLLVRNALSFVLESAEIYLIHFEELPPFSMALIAGSLIWLALLSAMSFFRGRLYCNTLCPVGTLLGLASKVSLFKMRIDSHCIDCKKCESVCKSSCINIETKELDNERCVRCFSCEEVCPVDAVKLRSHLLASSNKTVATQDKSSKELSRKAFLTAGKSAVFAGAALSLLPVRNILKLSDLVANTANPDVITPPGSISRVHFSSSCISCHLCTAVCPTKIIQPSKGEYGLAGALQPLVTFENGYCEFNCNACSTVCPTDAITPLSLKEKQRTKIGAITFSSSHCIVHKDGVDCGACAEHCPTGASTTRMEGTLRYPHFDQSLCIGCGACQYVCPPRPKALEIKALAVHEKAGTPKESSEPAETGTDEFPF